MFSESNNLVIKVGMFTTGMQAYWSQMPTIKEEILTYARYIETQISKQAKVINAGIVDTIRTARQAGDRFVAEDVDLIIIHAGTYGLSRDVLPCLRNRNAFVLMLNLQPVDSFDQHSDTHYTMPKNPFSIAGEIGSVLRRTGRAFEAIPGRLYDDAVWDRIDAWVKAARVKRRLRYTNIGILGMPYKGMLDLYVDQLGLINRFGLNVELIEMASLRHCVESVNDAEVQHALQQLDQSFHFAEGVTAEKLKWPVKVALGMERLCKEIHLQALTFNYNGYPNSPEEKIGYSMTLGGCLLYSQGIPCPAEGDLNLSTALVVMESLGSKSTQAELNIVDFTGGVNYINHSGPGNITIAQNKPNLRWLDFFHGKRGSGVSCEFSVARGAITLLSVIQAANGQYEFLVAEGESVEGLLLPNGNMNTRVAFPGLKPEEFIRQWVTLGPTHHCAMAVGHTADYVEKISRLYGINCTKIS